MTNAGMMLVLGRLDVSIQQPCLIRFYGFFEAAGAVPTSSLHVVVRVSPVDRVPEQRYQPRSRNCLRHPFGGVRMKQVIGRGLPGDGPPSVLPPRSWKGPAVPL